MHKETKISIEEIDNIIDTAEDNYTKSIYSYILKAIAIILIAGIYILIPRTFFLIPSEYTKETIDTNKNPIIVENYENINASNNTRQISKNKDLIEYKSLKNGDMYYIIPIAEYSISARIKEKNRFIYRQWEIDNIAVADYGLAWGDMAQDFYYKKFYTKFEQTKNGRNLVSNFKEKYFDSLFYKLDYMLTHVSHTYVIPANKNIKKALIAAREGQSIKLDGYLIDIFSRNYRRFAMSSISLSDINETSRGHGKDGSANEVMYVTKVQIGDKVFK